MTPTEARRDLHILPEGTQEVVYAKDQPEYIPLPSLVTPKGKVVTTWQPDAGELALLNNGVPVTLVLHTFNGPLTPVMLLVGGVNLWEDDD